MRLKSSIKLICFNFILIFILGCNSDTSIDASNKMFKTLEVNDTGIDFQNILTENDSLNYFTYTYLYMGGGISAGDINNDGLIDLYFTGNQVSNKLYLNKGNLKFEDITEKAGVSGDNRWYTGVTMADVNGDGFLDIYCSVGGKFKPKQNQLFINNQDGTFTEKAKEYGLDDIGNSVQATFFDYDKDGDLDVYIANYPPTKFSSPTFVYVQKMRTVKDVESDHLYRNDGNSFKDITETSGLKNFGLSLSATIGDLNNDSWPDIYVSNDFNSPDYLYVNKGDGTFKEVIKQATSHTAFYGMGIDIADFNNDGNLDIFQVDMDAQSNKRKKANMASMNTQLFKDLENADFQYQYMQNCLQINSGIYTDSIPHFSNISRLTGTSSTDWSWGPLFADFNNDGYKDLYITNGTRREIHNNDYFNRLDTMVVKKEDMLALSMNIPSEKIDNYMFQNKGNLDFERVNTSWGIEYEGFSNGVVYADLDNDGDLEIVTNNIDDFATVFENRNTKGNYISINFKGHPKNKFGIGNRVFVKTKNQNQMQELTLTRGFQSSVAPELHFGISDENNIEELTVIWFDGKVQTLTNVEANKKLTLNYVDAQILESTDKEEQQKPFLVIEDNQLFPKHKHQENSYDDFRDQVLLPHKMSQFGPALAVGDLNGDSLDDYFVGGSANNSGTLYFQINNGLKESATDIFKTDNKSEDVGALIFDADADGDNDLYVVSGGYEFSPDSEDLQDRLYINDGSGNFSKSNSALPKMLTSGSKAYAADFDKDGKQDLLVLGRQVPKNYPKPADSYVLRNVSTSTDVKFEPFSEDTSKLLEYLGMATSALITDFNNDGWQDFIIVGEWMPIKMYQNTKNGSFKEVAKEYGLTTKTTGWWWSISEGDFDNDGDMDYVLGNNGLNYKYKAKANETFDIYVNDFDNNDEDDIVLSYYNDGEKYPLRGRECSSQQIAGIKKKFENYETFSEATLIDVYSEEALNEALHYQVESFASIYLENTKDGFVIHQLPIEAQFSSINKILVQDFDKDKNLDMVIAGNFYGSEVETPRNDAGYGLFLKGNGKGDFKSVSATESGFFVKGDVKEMSLITIKDEKYILVASNNDILKTVKLQNH